MSSFSLILLLFMLFVISMPASFLSFMLLLFLRFIHFIALFSFYHHYSLLFRFVCDIISKLISDHSFSVIIYKCVTEYLLFYFFVFLFLSQPKLIFVTF